MIVINLNFLKRYDVALSFAEENRTPVALVAKLLQEQGIKVFYDDDRRIATWGRRLKIYLDKAFRLQARFCVVFVSEDYAKKRWTQFEMARAQATALFIKRGDYILPYLLDESEYARQFHAVGCLTHKTHNEYELAEAIIEKLDQQPERKLVLWFQDLYRIRSRFIAMIILAVVTSVFILKDHLTPVDILTDNLHERAGRQEHGSICRDSSYSHKQGSGACSWHHGVAHKKDTVLYTKTLDECRKEAKQISWWPAQKVNSFTPGNRSHE